MHLLKATLTAAAAGFVALLLLGAIIIASSSAWAKTTLLPGIYHPQGSSATALLHAQPDGSLLLRFWQGDSITPASGGFAYLGRLVPGPRGKRLTGTWQALPGSCCPGRGRQELQVITTETFRFMAFSPSLDRMGWQVDPGLVFRRVAGLPAVEPAQRLAGRWRLAYWYTNLLPGDAPADLVEGELDLSALGDALQGSWQGHPGQVILTPNSSGARLEYVDPQAGFQLNAFLTNESGGLALAGAFSSTLGKGQITLVRAGLPAAPPGPQLDTGGNLSGVWVDTRTGSDFFKINGSDGGFTFTAYGGSLAQPSYLSKGRALPAGPDILEGSAQDQPGKCCGNQGALVFRQQGPDRMEVTALWWPLGQPRPQGQQPESYVLQRTEAAGPAQDSARTGWPQIIPGKAGVPESRSGAVRVVFTWQPQGQPQEETLFSRGGYGRVLELAIDAQGHLTARLDTTGVPLLLRASTPLTPGEQHRAWLIYDAGDRARLLLDGQEVASAPMAQPWNASAAPYLIGGSRWPGRELSGQVHGVQLWAVAQDPTAPEPPQLTLSPDDSQPIMQQAAQAEQPATQNLLRLYNPGRLLHAYAADPATVRSWEAQGFILEGPIARLWSQERPGLKALWGFLHQGGYTLLQTSANLPPGCRSLGIMGYVRGQAQAGSSPLWGLAANFPQPLGGGISPDMLYTSGKAQVEAAKSEGYSQAKIVGYTLPVKEPALIRPVLYTWSGSWRGEGWGRFFLQRRGRELFMFWYYANLEGPHFFGRYQLTEGGRSAQGIAVSGQGKQARYYRHQLDFELAAKSGPRVRLTSWRLAAPLDDGRLVVFKNPRPSRTELIKSSQTIPSPEASFLGRAQAGPDPRLLYDKALSQARAEGRLLER
jgi:concanavalin A-like lectin/glucanase superfamily protein